MDEGDVYEKILAAQTNFSDAVDKVRREMSSDMKEMRKELLDTFQGAHKENKDTMMAIVETQKIHAEKDDKMFARVNWYIACAIGGVAVLLWIAEKILFK